MYCNVHISPIHYTRTYPQTFNYCPPPTLVQSNYLNSNALANSYWTGHLRGEGQALRLASPSPVGLMGWPRIVFCDLCDVCDLIHNEDFMESRYFVLIIEVCFCLGHFLWEMPRHWNTKFLLLLLLLFPTFVKIRLNCPIRLNLTRVD